jgi:hypothetical protein
MPDQRDPRPHLVLDGLPAPLLGNLLSHSLLVHTTVDNSPGDLSGVLPLEEEGLGLRVDEPEDLSSRKRKTNRLSAGLQQIRPASPREMQGSREISLESLHHRDPPLSPRFPS